MLVMGIKMLNEIRKMSKKMKDITGKGQPRYKVYYQ